MMNRAIIFISALILYCCFCHKSEAQPPRYKPGVLFAWENRENKSWLDPIAFIGKDSIYQPSSSGFDSTGVFRYPNYERRYYRKDSTYVIYHDGKVIVRFHVSDRDSSILIDSRLGVNGNEFSDSGGEGEGSAGEGEQIDAPWPPGIDSGLTLLGGSSCYFLNHEGNSEQPSPSVRKKILATCKKLFPRKWTKLPDSEIVVGSLTLLKLKDDSTQTAFVSIYIGQKEYDGTRWGQRLYSVVLYPRFFAILRQSGSTFIPEFTRSDVHSSEVNLIGLGDVIGQCDIDEDGCDDVVVKEIGYESSGIAIFQRNGTTWKKIYEYFNFAL